jgi:hypothetical protein
VEVPPAVDFVAAQGAAAGHRGQVLLDLAGGHVVVERVDLRLDQAGVVVAAALVVEIGQQSGERPADRDRPGGHGEAPEHLRFDRSHPGHQAGTSSASIWSISAPLFVVVMDVRAPGSARVVLDASRLPVQREWGRVGEVVEPAQHPRQVRPWCAGQERPVGGGAAHNRCPS